MIRADSTKFALDEAAALAEAMPEPPLPLGDDAAAFWGTIIGAKRRSSWTDADLLVACSLCRDLALMERLAREIEVDGPVLAGDRGKVYANPACTILDATQRRVLATCRQLQVHAVATQGKTDHQGNKNAASREISGRMKDAHSLIARPH
jgi:hypothetical protein